MKTFSWYILVDLVLDALLKVVRMKIALHSYKNKLKLSVCCLSLTNLVITNTVLLCFLLSSFLSPPPMSFSWGINSIHSKLFHLHAVFSSFHSETHPQASMSKQWATSMWSFFSEPLHWYGRKETTERFVSPVMGKYYKQVKAGSNYFGLNINFFST